MIKLNLWGAGLEFRLVECFPRSSTTIYM
jgi:hypothetical protein